MQSCQVITCYPNMQNREKRAKAVRGRGGYIGLKHWSRWLLEFIESDEALLPIFCMFTVVDDHLYILDGM